MSTAVSLTGGRGEWLRRASGVARYVLTCWKLNLAAAMEYRLSFFMLAGMMFVNNAIWLVFWAVFFHRFPAVNGWELRDVMLLWGISAGGFGWANVLFGNFTRIASIVANGELDVFLTQPKPLLINVLVSGMSLTAIGDFLFGVVIYALVGEHTLIGAAKYALGLAISGLLFLFVTLAAGTLAFFFGHAEGVALQLFNALVSFSTYPADIFKGTVRIVLFTVLPAGFISYAPIGLLRRFDASFVWFAAAAVAAFGLLAVFLFHAGLRRYTSGNRIAMRG
jgi:ABC-2 type transport system permease protein